MDTNFNKYDAFEEINKLLNDLSDIEAQIIHNDIASAALYNDCQPLQYHLRAFLIRRCEIKN